MVLKISKPHDDWLQFPKADISILPILDLSFFIEYVCRHRNNDSAFFMNTVVYTNSGRYALSKVFDIIGGNSENVILLPSFHCLSMVAPVVHSGAAIRFYKVKKDLSFDIEDIEKQITPETKAILVVHYFGFSQELSNLVKICQKHSIFLIEDCAHAYFGNTGEQKMGTTGDFAIASLKKFFPVSDGGVLISNHLAYKTMKQTPLSFKNQLTNSKNIVEEVIKYSPIKPICNLFSNKKKQPQPLSKEVPDDIKMKSWFDPAISEHQISWVSKWIISRSNSDRICRLRRKNYSYLLQHLNHLKTVVPLYSVLPDGTIPYMFPLILKNPDTDFKKLKMKKIPMWRWEELCISDCSISRYYSKHLIQLPCHQSLRKSQLDLIIQAIKELES